MGRKITLGSGKFYNPNSNSKTGEPATLPPGTTLKNLTFLESAKAVKSLYPDKLNHKFMENGDVVVVNGSNMLDALVAQIKPGEVVNLTYVGKEKCPFGKMKGKLAHTYEMEVIDTPTEGSASTEVEADSVEDDVDTEAF